MTFDQQRAYADAARRSLERGWIRMPGMPEPRKRKQVVYSKFCRRCGRHYAQHRTCTAPL